MTLQLTLVPTTLTGKGQRYAAMLGDRELCRSRQPFYEAARVLMAEGAAYSTMLEARHQGSDTVAMRMWVGYAAERSVTELASGGMRLVRWEPRTGAQDAPPGNGEASDFAMEAV
jgi:hypothetical protein